MTCMCNVDICIGYISDVHCAEITTVCTESGALSSDLETHF